MMMNERKTEKLRDALVGCTGFVGSNLASKHNFAKVYNSKNISEAYGTKPKLLVYAGIPAQKFLANQNPEADYEVILDAIENIKKIGPKEIVLISTIDVLAEPNGEMEDATEYESGEAYGRNRRYLEKWVEENFDDYLIIRLPGLYGRNLKKNFIYDLINFTPSLLSSAKMNELSEKNEKILQFYEKGKNDFYKLKRLNRADKYELIQILKEVGFSALNFTDSRGRYQFYDLANLWRDIKKAREHGIRVLHLATEPVEAGELYKYLEGEDFVNELDGKVPSYDFRTKYADLWNGDADGYISEKNEVLESVRNYVENCRNNKLKLAISNIGWPKELDEKVYEFLSEKQVRGLEIAPTRIVDDAPYEENQIVKAKRILGDLETKYGLKVVSMQSIWFGQTENIFESDDTYRRLRDYTFKAIDYAKEIGCPNLVFGCPKNRNMTDPDNQTQMAIQFFNEIGDYAEKQGRIIALEPNPKMYGTNFINTTSEAVKFVRSLSTDGVKINYDLGAAIENKEDLEVVRDNIDLINHIHISEPGLRKIKKRAIHLELLTMLKELNYDKYISIEMGAQKELQDIEDVVNYLIDVIEEVEQ